MNSNTPKSSLYLCTVDFVSINLAVDSVDGYSSYKSRQRSSSSVAVGHRTGESSSAGVVYDQGGVFKTPEPVDKPRSNTIHLYDQ